MSELNMKVNSETIRTVATDIDNIRQELIATMRETKAIMEREATDNFGGTTSFLNELYNSFETIVTTKIEPIIGGIINKAEGNSSVESFSKFLNTTASIYEETEATLNSGAKPQ